MFCGTPLRCCFGTVPGYLAMSIQWRQGQCAPGAVDGCINGTHAILIALPVSSVVDQDAGMTDGMIGAASVSVHANQRMPLLSLECVLRLLCLHTLLLPLLLRLTSFHACFLFVL